MSALAKLGALIWRFMSPHSHWWALNHSICLCLLVQVASSGSLKFHTPLKCPYKHSLTSPLLTYKISHDMWEPTSKSGTLIWRFIWLIRTIPLYLGDCNEQRYFGPFEVRHHTQGGSYVLEELDGTPIRRAVATFRLFPYMPQLPKNMYMDLRANPSGSSDQEPRSGSDGSDESWTTD